MIKVNIFLMRASVVFKQIKKPPIQVYLFDLLELMSDRQNALVLKH